jgi:phospholipid-binding lipoprotein MlaA
MLLLLRWSKKLIHFQKSYKIVRFINERQVWLSRCVLVFLGCCFVVGCATTTQKDTAVEDPYEDFNRRIYSFNQGVDNYFSGPIVTVYDTITPDFLQKGVGNFFTNLNSVQVVVNDLLQGKIIQGTRDTGRFAINSTLGVFGLFDIASYVGLKQNTEDFGQTLGVWGVPAGPYVVLPFLGPSTLFQGVPGATVDALSNPVTYATALPLVQALSAVNARSDAEASLDFINESALDPYVFTRAAYLQWRQHLITDGEGTAQASFEALEDEMFLDEDDDMELDLLESEVKDSAKLSQEAGQSASPESASFLDNADESSDVDRTLDLLEVELKQSAAEHEAMSVLKESNPETDLHTVTE